jgi:hypothetical protein
LHRRMYRLILIQKYGQNIVVVHLHRILSLGKAPFVTFVPVKIDVIVGGKVMVIPCK